LRSRILFISCPLGSRRERSGGGCVHAQPVDADAKVVSGIDIERTRNSPFGEYFLKQVTTQKSHLSMFTEMTGVDPRKDLFEILVASSDTALP
jgi:hypothetical protein